MFLQAPVFSAAGAAGIGDVDVREAEIRTGRDGETALVYGVFDDVDIRSEQRFDEPDHRIHASSRSTARTTSAMA